MNLFELFAKISLDTGDYEKGLGEASGLTQSFGDKVKSGFGTIAKVGAAAVGAASGAVVAFGKSAVDTGMQFDSSMAQVAATMGVTVDEIGELRDFAQEMGASTAFSASQAADALNYMALAGYDANTSMSMLPNVLNLAAAGGIDLAYASDMVTDSQSALGLSLEETAVMVDQMAKASSTTNTSVSQLGEAILQIGGTAKGMKEGTLELTQVLGLLADNGVKGAEGGTALRNIILSLTAPTDKAARALKELGVEVLDEEGNMLLLEDVFLDLQGALSNLSQGEQTEVLNTIFNKTDLKSVNALLGTSVDRWEEVANAIDNAKGSAQAMGDTQLDNLAGDITIFESALEGAKIALSDALTPSLRDFVQLGTQGLTDVTNAFKEDGLSGAMEALTPLIDNAVGMLMEGIPKVVEAGGKILGALVTGIINNLPVLAEGTVQLLSSLGEQLIASAPAMMERGAELLTFLKDGILEGLPLLAEGAVQLMQSLGQYLQENLPTLLQTGLEMILELSNSIRENAGLIVDGGIELLLGLARGFADSIPTLLENIPTIISNIAGLINDNAPKILAAGVEILITLAAGVIKAIPTLIAEFPKIIQAIVDVWNAFNWVSLGTKLITFIGNGIKSLITSIPKIISGIVETAGNVVKNFGWASLGRGIIISLGQGIRALVSAIPTALKNIATSAVNSFKSVNWKQVGMDIINGLISGVASMGKSAVDSVVGIGRSMVNGVKNFLGIASPSKVFASIGGYMAEGLEQGWEREYDDVRRTIESGLSFPTTTIPITAATTATAGGYGGAIPAYNTAVQERPITIIVQSVLDGKVIGEAAYKYSRTRDRAYGV